jgi:hypothetical protein
MVMLTVNVMMVTNSHHNMVVMVTTPSGWFLRDRRAPKIPGSSAVKVVAAGLKQHTNLEVRP